MYVKLLYWFKNITVETSIVSSGVQLQIKIYIPASACVFFLLT